MPYQRAKIPKITLEQWTVFKTVVDEGSYAQAAEVLNKSQSSVSYAISRLNALLATPALTIQGRKAELTPAGETLYRYADNLLNQAQATEQAAHYLAGGCESSVTLVTDALTPMNPVLCALQKFSQSNPHTRIRVLETSLSGTDEAVLQHECQIAVTARVPPGFLGTPVTTIRMIAVAHRDHPLAQREQVSETELRAHRQIVLRDSGLRREQDGGWLGAEQRWTFSHFATSVDTVKAGLGFAFLPEHRVTSALASGELVVLSLAIGSERFIPLSLVVTEPDHAGPATELLAQSLTEQLQNY